MQEAAVPPGGELRLITYREVLTADPTPVVAFVHLTSDGQDIWGRHDFVPPTLGNQSLCAEV